MQGFSDHLLVVNNSTREDASHDWLRHAAARNKSRVADSVRNWGCIQICNAKDFVFYRDFQTLKNNKSTRPLAECFLVFGQVFATDIEDC